MRNALMELDERLKWAREKAGIASATDAAQAVGEKVPTYICHENGSRGFGRKKAEKYARRFKVSLEWLLTEKGNPTPVKSNVSEKAQSVPLVGYVSAGAAANFMAAGDLGEVAAPENPNEDTVAVEIRGDSLGTLFDRWLVYYDNVQRPVTTDLIGQLCVIGLVDGRVLIKKIKRSRTKGLFHLISQTEDPILDVEIEWAAKVKAMVPQ